MTIERTITFAYPTTGSPVVSVTIPVPDRENSESLGRNLVIAKTTNGLNRVYDRGENPDKKLVWQFSEIKDDDRAALIVFLNYVNWGITPVKVTDWLGAERIVRVISQNIESINTAEEESASCGLVTYWNFSLDILDITGNIADSQSEALVPTALTLHLQDFNHPHNPVEETEILNTATVIDEVNLEEAHTTIFLVTLENETDRALATVAVSTDRDYVNTVDAANADVAEIVSRENFFGTSADVTFSAVLNGSGTNQTVRLRAVASVDTGWIARVRRVKL